MLKSEILDFVVNGENSGVEFKRDDAQLRPENLAKEIVAFANAQGGRILLGVEDDGSISGLQRTNMFEWILNIVRDKVHPGIIPFYEEVKMETDKNIGIMTISQGVSKPYVLRHNGREDAYIRLGNRAELATREQYLRLCESGGLVHVETLAVSGTSLESLDLDRLGFYLSSITKDTELPQTELEWTKRLNGLGLMTEDGFGKMVCTIAGLICFGINPRQFLGQAGIRLMAFDNIETEYQAQLDLVLNAPLVGRYRINSAGVKELLDDGLIEKFSNAILPIITVESKEIDKAMRREKFRLYPWEAIRETLINALVHRDWTRNVDVEVCLYSDRLEVISPGRLRNSMTLEKVIAGQRSPRNTLIMDIMRDYGYVDARGMGVRLKVIPLMKAVNHCDPVFEATEDYFKTILYRKQDV